MLFDTKFNDTILLIRLSGKCVSNCSNCNNFNSKNNDYYDLSNLYDILYFYNKYMSKSYSICFSGFNLINKELLNNININIEKIFLKKTQIYFHIGFNDILEGNIINNIKFINKNKYIGFSIQYFIKNTSDFNYLLKSILYLSKLNCNNKFTFYILFTNKKELRFLSYFRKKYNFKGNKLFIDNIEIEFNYSYGMDNISIFSSNICYGRKMVNIDKLNNIIYIESGIEIKLNGVLKLHSNQFCNKGVTKISNIFNSKEKIFEDFMLFENIISRDIYDACNNRCIKCLNNPIIIK